MDLIILADDLTGAADCAARCHHAGLAAMIALPGAVVSEGGGAICCTSDSRHLPAELAAQRVRELADGMGEHRESTWYKKIDSTLRGHVGQELDAALDALRRTCALICPAFPAQARGLANGYLVIEPAPADPPHLPTLLASQSRRAVAALSLDDVRAGADALAERLLAARQRGAELLVVDALDDADLQIILRAALQALPDALLCGSAGLAGALAAELAKQAPLRNESRPAPIEGPALLVIGSGSAMARRQIDYLRRSHLATAFELGMGGVPDIAGDLLLHLPLPPPGATMDGPVARRMAEQLAAAALPLVGELRPGLLVLSGGDTAIAVLASLGVAQLAVLRELVPGVPLMYGVDAAGQALRVVLKAGNHGHETTLADVVARARVSH
jgi:uncharacterized protein YgbK (DUF1537 family)